MAHQAQTELLNTLVNFSNGQDTESIDEGLRLLINEALRQERGWFRNAEPYEQKTARIGYSIG